MTTNVTYGNILEFIAEFQDSNSVITTPPSAVLNIVYPQGLTTASTSITMTLQNTFYTATWFSSVSDLGPATWTVTAAGFSTSATSGDLRIITP
jgi:hypothetical protein